MPTLKAIRTCMFTPKLIKIYTNGSVERVYEPKPLEKWGNQIIDSMYIIWKLGIYTCPFWGTILYEKNYLNKENLPVLTRFVTGIGMIMVISFCMRSIGRSQNPVYLQFLNILQNATEENIRENAKMKKELMNYDFDFKAWPVEYNLYGEGTSSQRIDIPKSMLNQDTFQNLTSLPYRLIAYFAIHTFGISLVYPGSFKALQAILNSALLDGRTHLVETYKGERFKIKTSDGNQLDTMFIDRRKTSSSNGNTLVVCCEGNAGFYEIGTMITPIETGYSVMGWNHPGFAGSTGAPYPDQEHNAVDAVMQFAINKLNFAIENILVFGWSIGGYTSSWIAINYPNIKGVILDATFDDVLPLAINQMPKVIGPIVKVAIRQHVNLNVAELLVKYPGPILLIRRTLDEVICLREGELSSNRGNDLLITLLKYRYPSICEESQVELLKEYLSVTGSKQEALLQKNNVNENFCLSLMQSYISEFSKSYPMKIGDNLSTDEKSQLVLFLARKYMVDFKSTHCASLPGALFTQPWDVAVENDFIFT